MLFEINNELIVTLVVRVINNTALNGKLLKF